MAMDALELLNAMTYVEYYSNGTGALTCNGMTLNGVMHTHTKGKEGRPGEELISQTSKLW